ncbi:response regulator transcription factor [Thalassospira alkalitolerans]|uniref:response regulator transcription factor n=1 Tax=Thalassospira alkalitolerans TaxID=1293890 RepID=UPI0030EBF796
MTRILLVDDDVELGTMLAEYLEGEGFDITNAFNGQDGLRLALDGGADGAFSVVLLDIMMPGMGGIEVLRELRTQSRVPVIMLTAKGDDVDRVVGLELGADDYIPKPYYPRELVARIRAVLRRAEPINDNRSKGHSNDKGGEKDDEVVLGKLRLNTARRVAAFNAIEMELTVSEFNLLEVLMRARERALSKNELSMKVLGRPREVYDRSIDVHMSNLRQKLQSVSNDAGLIETVRGFGYRLRQDI